MDQTMTMVDNKPGMGEDEVFNALQNVADNILHFRFHQLQIVQPLDDYSELLKLTITFLGSIPPRGFHFANQGQFIRLDSWHD